MGLELLLALFILVPLFAIQKYKNTSFYLYLNIGFYLLFLSYFVDAIDQIFIHSILFTFILEKAALVLAAIFIYIGSRQWMKCFEDIANTDYLTEVPNRRLISQIVNTEISNHTKEHNKLILAIIDIDYFKKINDEFGHSTGDAVLKAFAKFLNKSLNYNDVIGRWGGEEFIILMKNTDKDKAKLFMESLRINVSKNDFHYKGRNHSITISIGLSEYNAQSDDFESLLIKADKALYNAKNTGRNKVQF